MALSMSSACWSQAEDCLQVVLGKPLHADEQAAALAIAAGPAFDGLVELLPAAEVEVADAEVGAVGDLDGVQQGGEEGLLDVVEDAGHGDAFPWALGERSLPLRTRWKRCPGLGG